MICSIVKRIIANGIPIVRRERAWSFARFREIIAPVDELKKNREYVLWLLGTRDYPRATLERKLKGRGLGAAEARALLDTLAEEGLFIEKNYQRAKTRSLLKRGLGASLVKFKLRADRVTVSDADISQAYDELSSSPRAELRVAVEKALRKWERRSGIDPKDLRQKIVRSLALKGHRAGDVIAVMKELEQDEADRVAAETVAAPT